MTKLEDLVGHGGAALARSVLVRPCASGPASGASGSCPASTLPAAAGSISPSEDPLPCGREGWLGAGEDIWWQMPTAHALPIDRPLDRFMASITIRAQKQPILL